MLPFEDYAFLSCLKCYLHETNRLLNYGSLIDISLKGIENFISISF